MTPRLTRPRSIRWFEGLYFAAILLRPVNFYLAWPGFRVQLLAGYPDWAVRAALLLAVLAFIVQLMLGWLAARRRSRVAAALILLWILFAVVTYLADLGRNRIVLGPNTLLGGVIALLAAAAMAMLVLPESRRWFSGRPGRSDLERDFG